MPEETWSPGAPKRAPKSTVGLDALDELELPDGRKVKEVQRAEFVRVLMKIGVPGVSPEHGKQRNAERFAEHLDGIAKAAGKKAVKARLEEAKA